MVENISILCIHLLHTISMFVGKVARFLNWEDLVGRLPSTPLEPGLDITFSGEVRLK